MSDVKHAIMTDATGQAIIAALQSTDVAQQRIQEINSAAESTKTAAVNAIDQKGRETLSSIPDDYSSLSGEVTSLKEDLIHQNGYLPFISPERFSLGKTLTNGAAANMQRAAALLDFWYIENVQMIKSTGKTRDQDEFNVNVQAAFYSTPNETSWLGDVPLSTAPGIIEPLDGAKYMRIRIYYGSSHNVPMTAETVAYVFGLEYLNKDYHLYFDQNISDAVDNIRSDFETAGKNSVSFLWYTDYHYNYNSGNNEPIINDILQRTNVKHVVCGGDFIQHGTKASQKAIINTIMDRQRTIKAPVKNVFGNHDDNSNNNESAQWFSVEEVYGMMYSHMRDMTFFDTHLDYYWIDDVSKTMFVVLDTGTKTTSYTNGQATQLTNLLNANLDKNVIIFAHILFSLTEYLGTTQNFERIASAIEGHGNVKAVITGHTHYDAVSTIAGVPLICTDTCSTNLSEFNPNTATLGTVTELAMDVITVNYTTSKINCRRIGRGSDRVIG